MNVHVIHHGGDTFVSVEDMRLILRGLRAGDNKQLDQDLSELMVVGYREKRPRHEILATIIGRFLMMVADIDPAKNN